MKKKEFILVQAERLFSEKGYYGIGLTELLKACDIPKGSFYYYFPKGKLQLIQETLEHAFRHMEEGIRLILSQASTADEAFQHMLLSHADGIEQGRHYASHFVAMISIESVYLDPKIHETCKQIYRQWEQVYGDVLVGFGYSPEDTRSLVPQLFATIHGAMLIAWIHQDGSSLRELAPKVASWLAKH